MSESRRLLLELTSSEPTVLRAFNIIESVCLGQGLFCKIDGELCAAKFADFVKKHYLPFVKDSIRAVYAFGFIPFYLKTLPDTGDVVPEVLPHGTFEWNTEVAAADSTSNQQMDYAIVQYRVIVTAPLPISDKDVYILPHSKPSLGISAVSSPLSHVLLDYKNLRQAQVRRAHADAWNTTARMICTFKPAFRVQDDPNSALMDFADDTYLRSSGELGIPFMPQLAATNFWSRDAQVLM